jgi:CheY-like chemotaxis protein
MIRMARCCPADGWQFVEPLVALLTRTRPSTVQRFPHLSAGLSPENPESQWRDGRPGIAELSSTLSGSGIAFRCAIEMELNRVSTPADYFRRQPALRRVVAVVDDNPADVNLMTIAVREIMPEVEIEAYDCGEALLNRVHSTPGRKVPDLVLLDLHMPGMGGLAALAALKREPSSRSIPVIAVSGAPNHACVKQAYASHANCVIRKSDDVGEYLQAISHCAHFWLSIAIQAQSSDPTYGLHA